jgi:hypothetical protein
MRAAKEPVPHSAVPAAKLPPATVKLPEKRVEPEPVPTQKLLALKAATSAINATGGNGFRIPPKSARARKARANHHHGRAPPR